MERDRDNKHHHHHSNKASTGYAKWTAVAIFMGFQVLFLWKYLDKATIHSKPPSVGGSGGTTHLNTNEIASIHTTATVGGSTNSEPIAAVSETTTKTTTTTVETTTTTPVLLSPVDTISSSSSSSSTASSFTSVSGGGIQRLPCALRDWGGTPETPITTAALHRIYCDIFEPIRNIKQLRMLEVGFGCGNNDTKRTGVLQQHQQPQRVGSSAIAWTNYFTDLHYYGVDYISPVVAGTAQNAYRSGRTTEEETCIANFTRNYPNNQVQHVWFGDPTNSSFFKRLVGEYETSFQQSKWDIIIDKSGSFHGMQHVISTMHELWPHVVDGGFYAVEGLQYDSDRLFAKLAGRWSRLLAGGDFKLRGHPNADEVEWIPIPTSTSSSTSSSSSSSTTSQVVVPTAIDSIPPGAASISCVFHMCYIRKAFINEAPQPNPIGELNFIR